MTAFVLAAFLLGLVAGLRAMTAPAVVAWAASLGALGAIEGWFAFMAWRWTAPLATALAVGEWISDQLPSTPSRKVPVQFVTRLLTGALSGGTLGAVVGSPFVGICAGVAGSVIGTHAGAWARSDLARSFGRDRPAAILEDAAAVLIGLAAIFLFNS